MQHTCSCIVQVDVSKVEGGAPLDADSISQHTSLVQVESASDRKKIETTWACLACVGDLRS